MIWNFIRDFIVENITGGVTSEGVGYSGYIGELYSIAGEESEGYSTNYTLFNLGNTGYQISFGDWLATTLTTICMCLIVAFAIWLIIWVFKAVAHAFLLRR